MPRYNYNRQLAPPAAFVHVSLRRPTGGDGLDDVPAQIDTAADMTVLPLDVVESLRVVQLDQRPVGGFGGHVTLSPTFLVELTIRELKPVVVQALGHQGEPFVLLGRDVLNQYRLILDGPGQTLDIHEVEGNPASGSTSPTWSTR